MTTNEQKRLRELAENLDRNSGPIYGYPDDSFKAILAAIEPYRAALADSRDMLSTVVDETGWTAAYEHIKEIDALLGDA